MTIQLRILRIEKTKKIELIVVLTYFFFQKLKGKAKGKGKRGYIVKQGPLFIETKKNVFKKRWVVLDQTRLLIYRNEYSSQVLEFVALKNYEKVEEKSEKNESKGVTVDSLDSLDSLSTNILASHLVCRNRGFQFPDQTF